MQLVDLACTQTSDFQLAVAGDGWKKIKWCRKRRGNKPADSE